MKSFKISFPTLFALLIFSCLNFCSCAENTQTHVFNEGTEIVCVESEDIKAEEPSFFRKIWDGIWTVIDFIGKIFFGIIVAIIFIATMYFLSK